MVNYYTTPELVQSELRLEVAFDNNTLPSLQDIDTWIMEESKIIDLISNQVFSSTAISSLLIDYDGDSILRLPDIPIISVQKIEYNENSDSDIPSWIELQQGQGYNYLVYTDEGEVEFIHGMHSTNKITPKEGKKKLRISYTKGSIVIPLEIQKLCTLMVARRVILTLINSQSNTEGGDIQVGTIRVGDPSDFSIKYVKQLDQEVNDLKSLIGQKFKTYRINRVY